MKFNDIIKKSFVNNFMASDISTSDICVIIGVTLMLAIYIFVLYRIMNRKNFYNKNFNISLVALAVIIAAIIISIQSSIVVSLGMVGALSIVRFRTAVKEPLDLVYLFWAIAIGIICGVGLFEVAIIASVIISVVVFGLDIIPISKVPVIMVVQSNSIKIEKELIEIVQKYSKYHKIKSRNIAKLGGVNLIIELRIKNAENLLCDVYQIEGIEHVSIIDHNGETAF